MMAAKEFVYSKTNPGWTPITDEDWFHLMEQYASYKVSNGNYLGESKCLCLLERCNT